MFDKVLVAVGLKKKMCEFCNASPVFEGYDYCSKSCGQYAKMGAPPPARGPPRNPAPQTRGRGRGGRNAGGHGPPSPRMCFTCGTRPVYKDRDYCSRSCSEGIPWSGPPSSAPPYPSDRRTNDRTRYRDSRADGSRDRRYSDYNPRAPDSRRPPRRGHQSSDEDDLPDTPPPGTNPRRPPPGRRTREEDDEANRDYPEDDYEPPSHREPQRRRSSPQRRWDNPQRQRDSPPPKPLPRLPDVRSPPAAPSGSPWPPKTPQPRPRPRELGPYDEPQSD